MTRDELVECTALLRSIHEKNLDAVRMPEKPLDVLAQQVVAEVAARDWSERELFDVLRRAMPYATLAFEEYEKVLHLVSEGVSTNRGRSRVHVHRDRVNGELKARKGARLMAVQNGGAIPDLFTYPVIAEPKRLVARSTKTSPWSRCLVTCSCSAPRRGAFGACSTAQCMWRTPTACRPPCPSGTARHQRAPMSSPARSRTCAKTC